MNHVRNLSFLVEEVRAPIRTKLVLDNLAVEDCSNLELENIFTKVERIRENLPAIVDVAQAYTIENYSDLNWNFLETKYNFHSVFWSETESNFFACRA